MASFKMCPDCQAEYENPLDRRFHAQPNACPVCGPQVWFVSREKPNDTLAQGKDAIALTRRMLKKGAIVAIKGIGTNGKRTPFTDQRKHIFIHHGAPWQAGMGDSVEM